jgi:hypothetical protein
MIAKPRNFFAQRAVELDFEGLAFTGEHDSGHKPRPKSAPNRRPNKVF